jgi:N-acylglucosamine-6-phosphate 2-epimerase
MVAVDLTARPRPDGSTPAAFLRDLIDAIAQPILADVSTVAEGLAAAGGGASAVATTLSGYTPYSRRPDGPDLDLVAELVDAVEIPVLAEGRYRTADQVSDALGRGAHAVVVGTAITNPLEITRWFVEATRPLSQPLAVGGLEPAQEGEKG